MTARVTDEAARRSAHESRIKSRENPEQYSEEDKQLKRKEKLTYVKDLPKLYVAGSIPATRSRLPGICAPPPAQKSGLSARGTSESLLL
jgi:hypothetical protein